MAAISIVYIDKCAQMRETERTLDQPLCETSRKENILQILCSIYHEFYNTYEF